MENSGEIYNLTEYNQILSDLPGQKYSLDEQCQDLTGESTAYSVTAFPTVCSVLQCTMNISEGFTPSYNQALNFTTCGNKKVILNGSARLISKRF